MRSGSDRYELAGLAAIPVQGGEPTLCRHCATPAPERLARVVGVWSVIDGAALWDCDSCARARLQEIESRRDLEPQRTSHPVPAH